MSLLIYVACYVVLTQDLKKSVIDDGLKTLVDYIIKPAAGLQQTPAAPGNTVADYRSTVFRNASGVLRLAACAIIVVTFSVVF